MEDAGVPQLSVAVTVYTVVELGATTIHAPLRLPGCHTNVFPPVPPIAVAQSVAHLPEHIEAGPLILTVNGGPKTVVNVPVTEHPFASVTTTVKVCDEAGCICAVLPAEVAPALHA